VEGIAVAVRVGVADSKDEGAAEGTNVAEGGAGEAEAGRVAVGVAVLPHPAMNTPTTITSRKREAIIRFMGHLLSAAPNGSRYRRLGGTRQRHFGGNGFKPHKVPENAQTPTSRVHAVLGGVPHRPHFILNLRPKLIDRQVF
jgi:hypothetical protein